MPSSRASEVLYDSETILRLVDREIEDLHEAASDDAVPAHPLAVMLAVMQRANSEIAQVLSTLHDSREALQGVALQQILASTAKLHEVSSATEVAACRILDGLERAHRLVDRLDDIEGPGSGGDAELEAAAVRDSLRDELFAMMGSLQFQDITSQQLGHVSQMLHDVERRLNATSSLLHGGCTDAVVIAGEPAPTYSESASTRSARDRQAAADTIFWCGPPKSATH